MTLLTSAEAAKRLHISERTLRDIRQAGVIRYVVIGERKVFYRPEDCDEYVATRVRVNEPCAPTSRRRRKAATTGKIIPFSQRRGGNRERL